MTLLSLSTQLPPRFILPIRSALGGNPPPWSKKLSPPLSGTECDCCNFLDHSVQLKILGCIDFGHPLFQENLFVDIGNNASYNNRYILKLFGLHLPCQFGNQHSVGTGKDAQTDEMHPFLQGRFDNLLRRQANSRIDNLHSRISRPDGNLLGAAGMAVKPRFADEDTDFFTDLF